MELFFFKETNTHKEREKNSNIARHHPTQKPR